MRVARGGGSVSPANHSPCTWQRHVEPQGFGLAHLFILKTGSLRWVGRNRRTTSGQGQHRLTSILQPWMLLGPLEYLHWSHEGLCVFFQAATLKEKQQAFIQAKQYAHSEVCFPYPPLGPDGKEFICPPSFWECDDERAAQLDIDEGHFREHCVRLLRDRLKPGALIHDPACSTGALIAHLARALPHCRHMGSDRCGSMIDHARAQYASSPVHLRQADATVESINCDALILRFLNAEVMSRLDAEALLGTLLTSLNPGGVALVFGHTPVLPAVPWIAQQSGLILESCIASRPNRLELFQCYVLTRPSP